MFDFSGNILILIYRHYNKSLTFFKGQWTIMKLILHNNIYQQFAYH